MAGFSEGQIRKNFSEVTLISFGRWSVPLVVLAWTETWRWPYSERKMLLRHDKIYIQCCIWLWPLLSCVTVDGLEFPGQKLDFMQVELDLFRVVFLNIFFFFCAPAIATCEATGEIWTTFRDSSLVTSDPWTVIPFKYCFFLKWTFPVISDLNWAESTQKNLMRSFFWGGLTASICLNDFEE